MNSLDTEEIVKDLDSTYVNKTTSYLISGYADTKEIQSKIDLFVEKNHKEQFKGFTNFSMIFYKESKYTNIEELKKDPKIIYRYSLNNDLIIVYNWIRGRFQGPFKYKKGILIEPHSEVTISPAPPR